MANPKLIILTKSLTLALVWCNLAVAKANSDYQIELIIFKNNNLEDIYKESWPLVALKTPSNAQPITAAYDHDDGEKGSTTNYYKLLPNSALLQRPVFNKIKKSSKYTAISHISWLQPKKDFQAGKTVYFTTGSNYKSDDHSPDAEAAEISGTIKFSQKKYVHASLDLLLNLPVHRTNNPAQPFTLASLGDINNNNYNLQPFAISEQRRLKNGELNYFDNPAFGVILIVKEISHRL